MSNPLTTARTAVWTTLDGDTDLSTFLANGRKYKLNDGSRVPTRIAKSDCPCLIVYPASAPDQWFSPTKKNILYGLAFVGYTYGADASDIEDFFWYVYAAIHSDFPTLAQSNIKDITFTNPSFTALFKESGYSEFWKMAFTLVLTLREVVL